MAIQRIEYAGSVHDEEEVQAVLSVLRGGATALRIGPHTREMERLVAEAFGKARGVMVNSGSSALYLAVELLAPIVQRWFELDYMYGRMMDPSAVAEQVVNALCSPETIRRIAITPN